MGRFKLITDLWRNREDLDIDTLKGKAKAFYRMVPAIAKGEYTPKSKGSLVIGVGAIIYALSPLDFIPDFIAPFGILDDFIILGYGVKKVNKEIERFLLWEAENRGRVQIEQK